MTDHKTFMPSPLILMFCALAIATYTLRALRYAQEKKVAGKVIGNLPGYYAFYGFHKRIGIVVAYVLLLTPLAILTVVLPFLIPVILDTWDWKAVVYFMSCFGTVIFLIIPLSMINRVIDLMKEGIAILEHPSSNFPHFDIQDRRVSSQTIVAGRAAAIVPYQFVGCWKIQTNDPKKVYYTPITPKPENFGLK